MVHALLEAHRVLKPDGLLLDLRPAAVHRRVGIVQDGDYRLLWRMRESFEDDHAADRAVDQVTSDKHFKPAGRRSRLPCFRVMDTIEEFKEWLLDFVTRNEHESHDWLVERLERKLEAIAVDEPRAKTRIVVSAPLVPRVLRKKPTASR
jgi:hypothetical protein